MLRTCSQHTTRGRATVFSLLRTLKCTRKGRTISLRTFSHNTTRRRANSRATLLCAFSQSTTRSRASLLRTLRCTEMSRATGLGTLSQYTTRSRATVSSVLNKCTVRSRRAAACMRLAQPLCALCTCALPLFVFSCSLSQTALLTLLSYCVIS